MGSFIWFHQVPQKHLHPPINISTFNLQPWGVVNQCSRTNMWHSAGCWWVQVWILLFACGNLSQMPNYTHFPSSSSPFRELDLMILMGPFQLEIAYDATIARPVLPNDLRDSNFPLCHLGFSRALLILLHLSVSPVVTSNCEGCETTAIKVKAGEGSELHKSFGHRGRSII